MSDNEALAQALDNGRLRGDRYGQPAVESGALAQALDNAALAQALDNAAFGKALDTRPSPRRSRGAPADSFAGGGRRPSRYKTDARRCVAPDIIG